MTRNCSFLLIVLGACLSAAEEPNFPVLNTAPDDESHLTSEKDLLIFLESHPGGLQEAQFEEVLHQLQTPGNVRNKVLFVAPNKNEASDKSKLLLKMSGKNSQLLASKGGLTKQAPKANRKRKTFLVAASNHQNILSNAAKETTTTTTSRMQTFLSEHGPFTSVLDPAKRRATGFPGKNRGLQATASHAVAYSATIIQLSAACSGWFPVIEVGCSGGALEIVTVNSSNEYEATCGEHPSKGPSHAICFLDDIPQKESIVGAVALLDIRFICAAASKVGVVGEATILPETDLVCLGSGDLQASFVSVDYIDINVDPPEIIEDFRCQDGNLITLDTTQSSGCIASVVCPAGDCFLGGVSARQNTPIPPEALIGNLSAPSPVAAPRPVTIPRSSPVAAPVPRPVPFPRPSPVAAPVPQPLPLPQPSPAAPPVPRFRGGNGSVLYRATFFQLTDPGCSGFRPRVEVECPNGGSAIEVVTTSSLIGFDPVCEARTRSRMRCTFETFDDSELDEFSISLTIGFTCTGSQTELVGVARIMSDSVTCPRPELISSAVALEYTNGRESLGQAFSCNKGDFTTSESGFSFCFSPGFCTGVACTLPTAAARQETPIPPEAIIAPPAPAPAPVLGQPEPQPVLQPVSLPSPLSVVGYSASFIQFSSDCSGWVPYVQFGCPGGAMEIGTISSSTDYEATCIEHPDKGASYALCVFLDLPEEESFDGFVTLLDVSFVCLGTSKADVVGEATILQETDLVCSSSGGPLVANYAFIQYIDTVKSPSEAVPDFRCVKGDVFSFEELDIDTCSTTADCIARVYCDRLGEVTARQNTPIPARAFISE